MSPVCSHFYVFKIVFGAFGEVFICFLMQLNLHYSRAGRNAYKIWKKNSLESAENFSSIVQSGTEMQFYPREKERNFANCTKPRSLELYKKARKCQSSGERLFSKYGNATQFFKTEREALFSYWNCEKNTLAAS